MVRIVHVIIPAYVIFSHFSASPELEEEEDDDDDDEDGEGRVANESKP